MHNRNVNDFLILDAVFAALADPTRRRIIERLTRGSHTAGQLAAGFGISQPAISRHLKILESGGLMKRRIVGREHHFYLVPKMIRRAVTWLERQETFWQESLERLDLYLQEGAT